MTATTSRGILFSPWNLVVYVNLQHWRGTLSALRFGSISSECLFSKECTQVEQLGVGTVLIENEDGVCWRTDGSGLHSVVMAVWVIISCARFTICSSLQLGLLLTLVGLVCIFSKEHPVNLLSSLSLSCSISTSICLIKKRSKRINCS